MAGPDKPKADAGAKAPEVPKAPEAPKPAEGPEARQNLSDKQAQDISTLPEGTGDASLDSLIKIAKTLPENKFTEMFFAMVEQIKAHPELTGQFSTAILAITLWMAKYAKYMDMIPGAFNESLKDESLKDEKLSEEEAKTVLEKRKGEPQEVLTEEKKKAYLDMGVEKASASYVAGKLFGMTNVDSPRTLAAKIAHASRTVNKKDEDGTIVEDDEGKQIKVSVPYYKSVNLDFLKKNGMPFGTVIIFTPDKETGAKITAYATGDGDEIEFIDEKGGIKRANLNLDGKASSSLIASPWNFQAAFVPLWNSDQEYFAKHPDWVENRLTEEEKPEAPKDAKTDASKVETEEAKPEAPKEEPKETEVVSSEP